MCVPACYFIHLNKNLMEGMDRVCLRSEEAGGRCRVGGVCLPKKLTILLEPESKSRVHPAA